MIDFKNARWKHEINLYALSGKIQTDLILQFLAVFLLNVVYSAQNELLLEYDKQLGAQAVTLLNFIWTYTGTDCTTAWCLHVFSSSPSTRSWQPLSDFKCTLFMVTLRPITKFLYCWIEKYLKIILDLPYDSLHLTSAVKIVKKRMCLIYHFSFTWALQLNPPEQHGSR